MANLLQELAGRLLAARSLDELDREMDTASIFRALDGMPEEPNETLLLYALNRARVARGCRQMYEEDATEETIGRGAVHLACVYLERAGLIVSDEHRGGELRWRAGATRAGENMLVSLRAASPFVHRLAERIIEGERSREATILSIIALGQEPVGDPDLLWRDRDIEFRVEASRRFGLTPQRFHLALRGRTEFESCKNLGERILAAEGFLLSCAAALKETLSPSDCSQVHRGFAVVRIETSKSREPRLRLGLAIMQDGNDWTKWFVSCKASDPARVEFHDIASVLQHCDRLLRATTTAWLCGLAPKRVVIRSGANK